MRKLISLSIAIILFLVILPSTALAAPRLVVASYSTNKTVSTLGGYFSSSTIFPGDRFELNIVLNNAGTTDAEDVLITLTPTAQETGVYITRKNVWLDERIESGDEEGFSFEMFASEAAITKTYNFNVTITYSDSIGIERSSVQTIGIFVGKDPSKTLPSSAILLSSYLMSPSVVSPGGSFDLDLTLRNITNTDIEDIVVSVNEASGAIVAVETGNTKYVDKLYAGESEVVSFKMVSQGSAASKALTLDVLIFYEDKAGAVFSSTQKIGIIHSEKARTTPAVMNPQLIIADYRIDPSTIAPGSNFMLELTIKNGSSYFAKDIMVSVGQISSEAIAGTSPATAGGSQSVSNSIVVVGTGNIKYISSLSSKKQSRISFELASSASLSSGIYNLPIYLSCIDTDGNLRSSSQVIGLIASQRPNLAISAIDYPTIVYEGESFDLVVDFENRSTFSVKEVLVEITGDDFEITDGQLFVGTLDGEEGDTLEATLTPKKAGDLEATLLVKYRDDFNQEQMIEQKLMIKVEPAEAGPGANNSSATKGILERIISFLKALFGLGG